MFDICALGDSSINAPATVEITSGRVNITLNVNIDPPGDTQNCNSIETTWQFGENKGMLFTAVSASYIQMLNVAFASPFGKPDVSKKCKSACKIMKNEYHKTVRMLSYDHQIQIAFPLLGINNGIDRENIYKLSSHVNGIA